MMLAASLCLERGLGRLDGVHARHHVDIEGALPAFCVLAGLAGSVVDEDVEAAEGLDGAGDEGARGVWIREVGGGRVDRAISAGGQLGAGSLEPFGVAPADGDARPFVQERLRRVAADAATRAQDDRLSSSQSKVHDPPPARTG